MKLSILDSDNLTLLEEAEWYMSGVNGRAWWNVSAIVVRDFDRDNECHRISANHFMRLANFKYERTTSGLTSYGDCMQVICIEIYTKDGKCYKRDVVDYGYDDNREVFVCLETDSGKIVPDNMPIEDDKVKRLWTDFYEDTHNIPHDKEYYEGDDDENE